MILKPITEKMEILAWQAQARNDGLAMTNLFPDDRKMDDWLRRRAVFIVDELDDCRLLIVHEGEFDRLFYSANEIASAAKLCDRYQREMDCVTVLDVVGPQQVQDEASKAFNDVGFKTLKTLTRMKRRGGVESYECFTSAVSRQANANDAIHIHLALRQFFDARAEQLPCVEEVRQLCENGASFVALFGNVVCAFLLGEIRGKKGTIRYWFVSPEGRDKGVGGLLMRTFFDHCLSEGSSIQELWVLDDNENAIKRYEHYGFVQDHIKDFVFVKGE